MTKQAIQFFDTTLRDGEQTIGVNFSIEDKIKIAQAVSNWGADVIEAGFPVASQNDFTAVRRIGQEVTGANIIGLSRCVKKDIDAVISALHDTPRGQIHVFIATSPIHREAKLHMTKKQVIARIIECVSYARQTFDHVEFSPEDATRTEPAFLAQACQAAIDAGADVINIPDTVGYAYPAEMGRLFDYLQKHVSSFNQVIFSCHCHNDLGMATANTIAAIEHGATRFEGTINGIGERAGNTALEQIAAIIKVRKDAFGRFTDHVDLKQTVKVAKMVSQKSHMPISRNQPLTGTNVFAHESGIHQDGFLKNPATYEIMTPASVGQEGSSIPLGKLSGSHAVIAKIEQLGFHVDPDQAKRVYQCFEKIADQERLVTDQQLIAIMNTVNKKQ